MFLHFLDSIDLRPEDESSALYLRWPFYCDLRHFWEYKMLFSQILKFSPVNVSQLLKHPFPVNQFSDHFSVVAKRHSLFSFKTKNRTHKSSQQEPLFNWTVCRFLQPLSWSAEITHNFAVECIQYRSLSASLLQSLDRLYAD